jgi:trimeric autotransporter adhesin
MRMRAALLLAALAVAANAGALFGQGFQGGVRGAVKDAGGVIPGVEVTLTNEATNISRSTTSNEKGEYVFSNVDPGTYSVKATLAGYKTIDRKAIPVGTQQFITLDLLMEVGAIEENITVTGQSPIIETANASQGTVLDSAALQTLPSPGRAAFLIGTTVPTVIPTGDTQFNRQQDQTNASLLSLGGGTRRGNNYTLDGVPITDMRNRASANPSIEGLEDMKVQVHTYDAEMGRTGGGVFNTTLKSGSNTWRGTGFFQTRPVWGQANNYFAEKAGLPKIPSTYYLGGGAFGGPIARNRTFFWFSSEDYHDVQTRNSSFRMPTLRERAGDFSQTTNAAGQLVVIYDPLTGQPFPGNVVPASRINPVSLSMLKYLPPSDTQVANGSVNYNRTSAINNKFEQMYAGKVEHKFSDKVSLTGFYLYNRTDEPCANYFSPDPATQADQNYAERFADPNDYLLKRRPQVLALNNTWVLSDSSLMALRFGWTTFPDNNTLTQDFDPRTLGFSQTYAGQIQTDKFPQVRIRDYDNGTRTLGAINPTEINWKSLSVNGAYNRFVGTHTFKFGADFRKIGVDTLIPGNGAGFFDFDRDMTSSNGANTNSLDGNAMASFLLGFPSALRESQLTTTTPLNVFTYYYGGYAQDDWRVSSKFTLNYGLRIEHEDGLHEQNNNFTVGFDPTMSSSLSTIAIAADPVAGTAARNVTGGLMYAGVNGNKITQGNPQKVKWSPRVGAVYSMDTKTVVRGGYGMYWAPFNYPVPDPTGNNYGQVGYTNNTTLTTSRSNPTSITNPFPTGIAQPSGNSLGALTNLDSNISYVDQNRKAPRVQQYSVDVQRELPGNMAFTASYVGAQSDFIGLGGSNDTAININQLDPKYLALGAAALGAQLPNPFLGNPNVPRSLSTPATLSRARLLLPFPQYRQINARQVTEGRSRYNAGVFELNKRMTHGIGGRFSYTYSVLKDNQIGEGNFYTAVSPALPVNNYNYLASYPACAAGQDFTAACYNPLSEYGYSVLDVPHRVILAPIVELPFGTGKKWAKGRAADLIVGGWVVSTAINFQSGFPLNVQQNADGNLSQGGNTTANRPNIVAGADLGTSGDYYDRLSSADHPTATWINRAAFSLAPAGTFGNAPRTITDLRTPPQYNVDAVFIKNFHLTTSKVAQLKIEMLNMFNRPNVRALQGANNFSNTNFGQTNIQAGFMRITQVMFRFSF